MLRLLIGLVAAATIAGIAFVLWRYRDRLKWNHALVRHQPPKMVIYVWMSSLAAWSALVVVAQAIDRNTPKTTMEWVHEPKLQLNLALALALATFVEALRRLWRRITAKGISEMRAKIHKHLGTAIANACEVSKVPVQPGALGCGLFMVQHHWFGPPTLRRVERLRLLDTMGDSGLVYVKGKGTVGMCWEGNRREHHTWSATNKRYDHAPPTKERWDKMRQETRHGFTFEEWKTMLGRYAEVLAVPVTVKGTFVGCLALDRRWDRDEPDAPECLKSATMQEAVGAVARALEPVLDG